MRNLSFLVFDDVQTLDVVGPIEVFDTANTLDQSERFSTRLLSLDGSPIHTASGLKVSVDGCWHDLISTDTAVVPGGRGVRSLLDQRPNLDALQKTLARASCIASVCTGAFLLAELGFLDGCQVATHWAVQDELATRYPSLHIARDQLYVHDGVWSSAGVTAGMDLALALVEQDAGIQLAHAVAQWLVLYMRRWGDGPQRSMARETQAVERRSLARAVSYIANHLQADLRIETVAKRVGMSPRNFARNFRHEFGGPPGAYIRQVRLQCARNMLVQTDCSLDEIAARTGLGSRHSLSRAFNGAFGLSPTTYRNTHRGSPDAT